MLSYVDRDLIRSFLLTFITLLALVQVGYLVSVLLQMSQYLFGGGDSKLGYVLLYYVSSVPRQTTYTIPVATAITVLWVYTMKARQNEVLAFLSGGVSPLRLAAPMIVLGAIFSVSTFLIIELVANAADRYAEKLERVNIQGRDEESLTRESNAFQKGRENRFYNIRRFNPVTETMILPLIIDTGNDWTRPDWKLEAKTGQRVAVEGGGRPEWVFHDVIFRRWNDNGDLIEYREHEVLRESEMDVPLEEELTPYLRQRFRPAQMGFFELRDWIGLFKEQNKDYTRLQTFLYFNFAIPLGTLVLTLLMCGHILRPTSTGVIVGFGGGLIFIAIYYVLLMTCRQLAMNGAVHPALAAFAPNFIFLLVGGYLIHSTRRA